MTKQKLTHSWIAHFSDKLLFDKILLSSYGYRSIKTINFFKNLLNFVFLKIINICQYKSLGYFSNSVLIVKNNK